MPGTRQWQGSQIVILGKRVKSTGSQTLRFIQADDKMRSRLERYNYPPGIIIGHSCRDQDRLLILSFWVLTFLDTCTRKKHVITATIVYRVIHKYLTIEVQRHPPGNSIQPAAQ